jgi:GT2 family glycosyltransferase
MKNDRMRRVDVLFGIFWLLRRGALESAGLLDEDFFMYGEDMDLCKRFREGGWEIIYFPAASIVHYGGGSSESDPMRFYLEKQKSDFLYWKKYHNRLSQALYLLMMFSQQGFRFLCWSLLSGVPLGETGRDSLGFKMRRSLMAMRFCLGLLCRRSG